MFTLPARSRLRAIPVTIALIVLASALVSAPAQAAPLTITNVTLPAVGGPPTVGYTLGSSTGSWSVGDLTYDLQWLADGVAIPDATAATYKITAADVSKKLSIRVIASKDGYESGTATSVLTEAIQPGTIANVALPTVGSPAKMGYTLGSSTGSWTVADLTYALQWFADGVAIPDATAATYKITAADVSKKLSIRVIASKDGYESGTATSVLTEAIQPGTIVNVVPPTIYGSVRVGEAVGVNAGSWSPGGVEWSYRWFADGVLLAGVTTKTFVPGAALFGKSLRAEVTGGKAGYASATGSSAASIPLTCTLARPTGFSKSAAAKKSIRVGWTKATCATKYVVTYAKAGSKKRKSVIVGDVATVNIAGLARHKKYTFTVASIRQDGVRSPASGRISVRTRK